MSFSISYPENNTAISLKYANSITTGTQITDTANVMGRVAAKSTNSPIVTIGPLQLESGSVINSVSYNILDAASLKAKFEYSTNGSSYTTLEFAYSLTTTTTAKGVSGKSFSTTSLYLKWTITAFSSTKNKRDFQLDDITIHGTSPSGGH